LVPTNNRNEDNESAALRKWLNSHAARLPMFFKVTTLTSDGSHHDFRLGLFGSVNESILRQLSEKSETVLAALPSSHSALTHASALNCPPTWI
jgi:hypothetical protein